MGINNGDKVLVMLPNIPEWWEIMLGLMRLNAIPIPATTLLTAKDIRYRLSAADIKAIIATDEEAQKIEEAVKGHSNIPILIVINTLSPSFSKGRMGGSGWHNYIKERDKADAYTGERALPDEPSIIYFTSGTTGPPKMVLHTQASYPLAHIITSKYWLDLRPGDIHWNISDTGWAKAAWSSLLARGIWAQLSFHFTKRESLIHHLQ